MDLWSKLDAVEPMKTGSFELLPEGKYNAEITDVTIKDDPEEKEFDVEFTITGPSHTGRKCWMSSRLDATTSDKKLAFIKGQICKMAGVSTTGGNPLAILSQVKGNSVKVSIKHSQGIKDPSKTYANVYVDDMTLSF
jgi:hypothetical protein